MGWLLLALLMLATGVLLWRLGLPRAVWTFPAAAMMLAATGYAVQGQAGLLGHPVAPDVDALPVDPGLAAFRSAILPGADAPLAAADAALANGDRRGAVDGVIAAIGRDPNNAALWAGLGSVLVTQAGGQMSPAAKFAFARAVKLAPDQPGPPFFLGTAFVQGGDLKAAKTAWLQALRLAPRNAPYRVDIAERLVLIDRFNAMMARQTGR